MVNILLVNFRNSTIGIVVYFNLLANLLTYFTLHIFWNNIFTSTKILQTPIFAQFAYTILFNVHY